ncbi:MAG: hypothetical protein WCC64_22930 [Aliidongia sp.]
MPRSHSPSDVPIIRTVSARIFQELIIIITALGVTTPIVSSLQSNSGSIIKLLYGELSTDLIKSTLLFVLTIISAMRFYLGNLLILNINYVINDKVTSRVIWFDFGAMLIMSLFFSVMGFLTDKSDIYFEVYAGLLFVSVIWSLFTMFHITRSDTLDKNDQPEFVWMIVNLCTLIICVIVPRLHPGDYEFIIMYATCIANCVADIALGWKWYFPAPNNATISPFPAK